MTVVEEDKKDTDAVREYRVGRDFRADRAGAPSLGAKLKTQLAAKLRLNNSMVQQSFCCSDSETRRALALLLIGMFQVHLDRYMKADLQPCIALKL